MSLSKPLFSSYETLQNPALHTLPLGPFLTTVAQINVPVFTEPPCSTQAVSTQASSSCFSLLPSWLGWGCLKAEQYPLRPICHTSEWMQSGFSALLIYSILLLISNLLPYASHCYRPRRGNGRKKANLLPFWHLFLSEHEGEIGISREVLSLGSRPCCAWAGDREKDLKGPGGRFSKL